MKQWIQAKLQYMYWFAWGMYQQARYGSLPKTHYKLVNGEWQATWSKRKITELAQ